MSVKKINFSWRKSAKRCEIKRYKSKKIFIFVPFRVLLWAKPQSYSLERFWFFRKKLGETRIGMKFIETRIDVEKISAKRF